MGRCFRKRGELDKLPELEHFGTILCEASVATIEDGIMTGDLISVAEGNDLQKVNTEEFLTAVRERLEARL